MELGITIVIILVVLFVCCSAGPVLNVVVQNRKQRPKGMVQLFSSDAFILDECYRNAMNKCWRSLDVGEKAPDFDWAKRLPKPVDNEKPTHPYAFYFRIKANMKTTKKDAKNVDRKIFVDATLDLIKSFHADNCNLTVYIFRPINSAFNSKELEPYSWQDFAGQDIVGIVMIDDLDPESYDNGAITLWADGSTIGSEYRVARYDIPLY